MRAPARAENNIKSVMHQFYYHTYKIVLVDFQWYCETAGLNFVKRAPTGRTATTNDQSWQSYRSQGPLAKVTSPSRVHDYTIPVTGQRSPTRGHGLGFRVRRRRGQVTGRRLIECQNSNVRYEFRRFPSSPSISRNTSNEAENQEPVRVYTTHIGGSLTGEITVRLVTVKCDNESHQTVAATLTTFRRKTGSLMMVSNNKIINSGLLSSIKDSLSELPPTTTYSQEALPSTHA